jgi:hypothetical protein
MREAVMSIPFNRKLRKLSDDGQQLGESVMRAMKAIARTD